MGLDQAYSVGQRARARRSGACSLKRCVLGQRGAFGKNCSKVPVFAPCPRHPRDHALPRASSCRPRSCLRSWSTRSRSLKPCTLGYRGAFDKNRAKAPLFDPCPDPHAIPCSVACRSAGLDQAYSVGQLARARRSGARLAIAGPSTKTVLKRLFLPHAPDLHVIRPARARLRRRRQTLTAFEPSARQQEPTPQARQRAIRPRCRLPRTGLFTPASTVFSRRIAEPGSGAGSPQRSALVRAPHPKATSTGRP